MARTVHGVVPPYSLRYVGGSKLAPPTASRVFFGRRVVGVDVDCCPTLVPVIFSRKEQDDDPLLCTAYVRTYVVHIYVRLPCATAAAAAVAVLLADFDAAAAAVCAVLCAALLCVLLYAPSFCCCCCLYVFLSKKGGGGLRVRESRYF